MEHNKDHWLTEAFDGIACRTAGTTGATKVVIDGSMFFVCRRAAYMGPPDERVDGLKDRVFARYSDELPMKETNEETRFKPECALGGPGIRLLELPGDKVKLSDYVFISCAKTQLGDPGLMVCTESEGRFVYVTTLPYTKESEDMMQVPVLPFRIPVEISSILEASGLTLADLEIRIRKTLLGPCLMVTVTGECGFLYTVMDHRIVTDTMRDIYNPQDGCLYCGDGLQPNKTYKRIIKKKGTPMKGLGNPLTGKKPAAQLVTAVPDNDTEINNAVTAVEKVALPTAAEAAQEEATPPAEAVEEAPAASEPRAEDVPAAAQDEKPAKAKRQVKQAKAVGFDFTKVLEYVGSPAPAVEPATFDKVMEEIRTLRDLQIAAARRAANLATQVCVTAKDAIEKIDALHNLFNK